MEETTEKDKQLNDQLEEQEVELSDLQEKLDQLKEEKKNISRASPTGM